MTLRVCERSSSVPQICLCRSPLKKCDLLYIPAIDRRTVNSFINLGSLAEPGGSRVRGGVMIGVVVAWKGC